MHEIWTTFWQEIAARPSGPMAFRFYLQPIMAAAIAIHDGMKDAHSGRPPYLFSLAVDPQHRRERLLDGWKSVSRVFVIAVVMDIIYQLIVLHMLRPLETIVVAVTLAILPYALVRGPARRIAGHMLHRPHHAK